MAWSILLKLKKHYLAIDQEIKNYTTQSLIDTYFSQSQSLKYSDYRIGRGFISQEWRRSAGKRFTTCFEMLYPANIIHVFNFHATENGEGLTKGHTAAWPKSDDRTRDCPTRVNER